MERGPAPQVAVAMGLEGYLKSRPAQPQSSSPSRKNGQQDRTQSSVSEKPPLASSALNEFELQPPTPHFGSRRQSMSGRSVKSAASSVLDDIKHEIMVNYLYQQQCGNLWVSDGSGKVEGVLLRKSRGHYMACPPALGSSSFAMACTALNVQVRHVPRYTRL